ncbi:MAG: zf-HC2 domain-containing protein [Lachnospiraceae bacterium]|nr:zf-HC2 domain-containing protein [Lachnospiraceae bacterium]
MNQFKLNCKQVERLIPDYINNKLSDEDTKALIEHVESCPSCKEELTIQYLVFEGLNDVEESGDFNLITRLNLRLKQDSDRFKEIHRRRLMFISLGILALCFVMFVVAVLLI